MIYRTISLLFPFVIVRLTKRHIVLPYAVYAVILIVLQQSIPWWYGKSDNIANWNDFCVWNINNVLGHGKRSCKSDIEILTVVQLLLPLVVALFLIVIIIKYRYKIILK